MKGFLMVCFEGARGGGGGYFQPLYGVLGCVLI